MTDHEVVRRALGAIADRLGRVDVTVNSVGPFRRPRNAERELPSGERCLRERVFLRDERPDRTEPGYLVC